MSNADINSTETQPLVNKVTSKIDFLQQLQQAIEAHDDRQVYALIDQQRYDHEIQKKDDEGQPDNTTLISDVFPELSSFLSTRLVEYLHKVYPFFYFEETPKGQYQFYFGNWWGRRLFGTLDVLNVKLVFNDEEYEKVATAFALEAEHKRYNSDQIDDLSQENDRLQQLIDEQDKRDQRKAEIRTQIRQLSQEKGMFFGGAKQRGEKQQLNAELSHLTALDEEADNAYDKIKQNNEKVLALSKEDTLIGYEKQSIVDQFGSFKSFEQRNNSLYRDYIAQLIAAQD